MKSWNNQIKEQQDRSVLAPSPGADMSVLSCSQLAGVQAQTSWGLQSYRGRCSFQSLSSKVTPTVISVLRSLGSQGCTSFLGYTVCRKLKGVLLRFHDHVTKFHNDPLPEYRHRLSCAYLLIVFLFFFFIHFSKLIILPIDRPNFALPFQTPSQSSSPSTHSPLPLRGCSPPHPTGHPPFLRNQVSNRIKHIHSH